MSFAEQEDVFAAIEPLYARFVRELHGIEVETPFPRIPYDEMLARFGTDKPDLRYGMEPVDLADVFTGPGSTFASVMATEGGAIKGLAAPGASLQKELDQLVQDAKGEAPRASCGWSSRPTGSGRPSRSTCRRRDALVRASGGRGRLDSHRRRPGSIAHVALDGVRRHLADRLG